MKKDLKCRVCYIPFSNISELEKHFKKHQFNLKYTYRLKVKKGIIIPCEIKETTHSINIKKIQDLLLQNNVYFEMLPSFFVKELDKEIYPTFMLYSWKNIKLKTPFYLWIESENDENIKDFYYLKKHTRSGTNHFIIRNMEKMEQYVITFINKIIERGCLNLKISEDSKYTVISP
mgnify:CR=1 FL=1